ncbi:MAG: chemotaxis response regulator protein-glutamate methylesterase [Phycisphaerales bacterium]|nr:chemotaxis response regulator protein-glutamate methylesterase [Phycisphaerales bacterium]
MRSTGTIKTLIVDDSPLVRSILTRVLDGVKDIEVVGGAKDPYEAREMIINYRPDVILLDIEMPRMDGITFLRKLMEHYPVPVIMCSSVAPHNSRNALEAIEIGAVDVVAKPTAGGSSALRQLAEDLTEKIRAAAVAMPSRPRINIPQTSDPVSFCAAGLDPAKYLVAIGASTGGTEAIRAVLQNVPPDFPPVVMVQHMPEGFTQSFAERLNGLSVLQVTEAVDGDILVPGRAFLARGNIQMRVVNRAGQWRISYGSSEPVNRHCPSVDVLFDSVAAQIGARAVGVLLTGMGADGARGLLNMRQAGAYTVAQNQASCVVYGMPKVAVDLGAVQQQCSPPEVARIVLQALRTKPKARIPAKV